MSSEPSPLSVADYLEFLKERVLGDALKHEEIVPACPRRLFEDCAGRFPPTLCRILEGSHIPALYSHQAEGIQRILEGQNVVMATPTASGKTLVYNAPVVASLLDVPHGRALYVFPLKALEQDQLEELSGLLGRLQCSLTAAIYDGDTTPYARKKLRAEPPDILVTTPDMLHAGLLAFHEQWEHFFAHLRFVVVDELHTYSGVFGSHVAQLLRRLNRICAFYGSDPVYIACSATMGNPAELAEGLFNRPFHAVKESGAPTPTRHFLFLNPVAESPNTVAAKLLRLSVVRQFRTIVFTRARVVTELVYRWATHNSGELRQQISSYRAGYLPEERREIEASLASGDLLGVVSTSALELGIDIGGLDICILVGYPGSVISTWQRAGRVGRAARESIVLLVASRDAQDQFFMKFPERFFGRGFEDAVVDIANKYILNHHLACAARELPLTAEEPEYDRPEYGETLARLVSDGALLQGADGDAWFAARKQPHRLVSMRTIGESWTIYEQGTKFIVGTVSGQQVYGECYHGAVYLHRGRQFEIIGHDVPKHQIHARVVDVPYYTRAKTEKETEILAEMRSRPMSGFMAYLGRLKVSSQVVGFEKLRVGDQVVISQHSLDSPTQHFETVGFWLELEDRIRKELKRLGYHYMGSIHAIEHVIKSLFPFLVLSNRTDVGGICYPHHPQLGKGAIFVYDFYPGGIGLAEKGFDLLDELLNMSLELVAGCDCELGCPSCIHFPTCGAGNVPLDKGGCGYLLEVLSGRRTIDRDTGAAVVDEEPPLYGSWEQEDAESEGEPVVQGPRIVVFDLETQRSAAEVGGWNKAHLMGMSVGIVWDSLNGDYTTYLEKDVAELIVHLERADLIVGFNIIGFDYAVLRGYSQCDFGRLNTLDILREVHTQLKYRVSLDALGRATLNMPKTADGLQALAWWKEGRIDMIEEYCRKDVEVTRRLFDYAVERQHLLFDRKGEGRMRIPLAWDPSELAAR